MKSKSLAVLLTLAGVFLGLCLSLLAVWADYESTSYGFFKRANAPLRGLRCPPFIGREERKTVSVVVSNSTDQPLSPSVRMELSSPQEPVAQLDFTQLGPGESTTIRRTVGPENVDLGFFIFVNASVFSMYPQPDRENTCGILVLPVRTGSSLILLLGSVLSLGSMLTGSWLLYAKGAGTHRSGALLFMTVATTLALVFVYLGWWVQPLFLMIMVVLTFLINLGKLF